MVKIFGFKKRILIRCLEVGIFFLASAVLIPKVLTAFQPSLFETETFDMPTRELPALPPSSFDITAEYAFRKNTENLSRINWTELWIEPYKYQWTHLEANFCTERYANIKILIIVHTAPDHFERRKALRHMYGDKFYSKFGMVTLFAVGKAPDEGVQELVNNETLIHRDIIQQDFWDVYETLSYKAVMWMRFVSEYCKEIEYVFKMDDDTVINLYRLKLVVDNLKSYPFGNRNRTITGLVRRGTKVNRDKNSKWYVSPEEFAYNRYKIYCPGLLVIIPGPLIHVLFSTSQRVRFFRLDDVFLTGYLPTVAGNVTYNDISEVIENHIPVISRQRFLNELVFVHAPVNTSEAISEWDELQRLHYNASTGS